MHFSYICMLYTTIRIFFHIIQLWKLWPDSVSSQLNLKWIQGILHKILLPFIKLYGSNKILNVQIHICNHCTQRWVNILSVLCLSNIQVHLNVTKTRSSYAGVTLRTPTSEVSNTILSCHLCGWVFLSNMWSPCINVKLKKYKHKDLSEFDTSQTVMAEHR